MWKFLLPFAAFIALAVLFAFGLNPKRDIRALPSPLIGKTAPVFTLQDVNEPTRTFSNASLKGDVYLLNVWGTWCEACRQEHPYLLQIAQQKVLPIVGLVYMDKQPLAKEFLSQFGNPYDAVALDNDGRTAIDWGVTGAPETYLVDGTGKLIFKYVSPVTTAVWEREFLPRIAAARKSGGA
jgi:cytochrome c biogenesis protein CcmG/thiol:disulfide interchange protein DsbE